MFTVVQTRCAKAVLMAILTLLFAVSSFAATLSTRHEARGNRKIKESANTEKRMAASRHSRAVGRGGSAVVTGGHSSRRTRYYERFTASSFAAIRVQAT